MSRAKRIALFGGTFDPIHAGHLAVARAARRALGLDRVYFVTSGRPPHRRPKPVTPFIHRHAMVTLACGDDAGLLPSLLEAGPNFCGGQVHYSIDTVRRMRQRLSAADQLYFIVGADAFAQIRTWKDYRALLESCSFVVANRPGFSLSELARVLPEEWVERARIRPREIVLDRTSIHLLPAVHSPVRAREIRRRVRSGQSIRGLVPGAVEDYIRKMGLYVRA